MSCREVFVVDNLRFRSFLRRLSTSQVKGDLRSRVRMRIVPLSLLLLPMSLLVGGTHDDAHRFRPTSYVVTLVQDSRPGRIHDPDLHIWPDLPIFPGLSRVKMSVWFDNWKWHEADRWLVAPPAGYSSLARFTTAPLPSTSASDGHRIWTSDPAQHTVTVYPPDPAGTWPASEGYLKRFTQQDSLEGVLQSGFHCTTGVPRGTGRIAGRAVHIVEFAQDRCRHLSGGRYAHQSRLLDGRLIVWLDTETFFTLRADQYAFGKPNQLLVRTYVTSMKYNVPVNQALFRLRVPPGYKLIHGH
jgi:outer membrane lipoprotein-sorting protein